MTLAQIQALARAVGFPDPALAAAVAMAESGGNPTILGDLDLGTSVGLWQINLAAHPDFDAARLTDPTYNAQAAYAVSQGGRNWKPWTTFRTGAYLRYLTPSPVMTVGRGVLLAGAGVAVAAALSEGAGAALVRLWRRMTR